MATKPSFMDWVSDDSAAKMSEPSTEKKLLGWVAGEKPPFQYHNWLQNVAGKWIRFFDKVTNAYDVVIGSGLDATHATLEAAVADADVGTNVRVLLRSNITGGLTATSLSKAGWKIDARPGVTFTKGTATTGLSVAAANITIQGLRFAGFSVASDKAIAFTAAGDYGRVLNCNFVSADTEVDDASVTAGKKPIVLASITE